MGPLLGLQAAITLLTSLFEDLCFFFLKDGIFHDWMGMMPSWAVSGECQHPNLSGKELSQVAPW